MPPSESNKGEKQSENQIEIKWKREILACGAGSMLSAIDHHFIVLIRIVPYKIYSGIGQWLERLTQDQHVQSISPISPISPMVILTACCENELLR